MRNEIVRAIVELKQAEQNFQYANNEFVEIAILQLKAAEQKVTTLISLKVNKKKVNPLRENPLTFNRLSKLFTNSISHEKPIIKKTIRVNIVNSAVKSKHLMAIGKNF